MKRIDTPTLKPATIYVLMTGEWPTVRLPGWVALSVDGQPEADAWAQHRDALIAEAGRHHFEPYWQHQRAPRGAASRPGAPCFSQGIATDMPPAISRCDPCGCGAELAVLLNRLEALTATVADLVLEVRAWRADQARRRAASEQDDRDAVLGALIGELVGDDAFSAADVIALGGKHVALRHALTCAGASNGRRLGHLLSRLEARRGMNDGIHFVRIGADRGGCGLASSAGLRLITRVVACQRVTGGA